ncbi:hypothetical protein CYMTET_28737 [Cymbomonas tetramitiformis]|uniref:folate gamma-glutamyl hydrolase n=1 Tax=Cymbomonas tetramitiformis TaxID=36881 RepID=A0AAE0FME5_9CHLO|nr:hypothetical protein CYMTET_28737 [Cymbomonas tetramitiformis]
MPGVSYIASSYVKLVEMAGARAVPIIYTDTDEEIIRRYEMVNGLIFPGGAVGKHDASSWDKFEHVAHMLFTLALRDSLAGDPFPIHGVCMGLHMLMRYTTDAADVLYHGLDAKEHLTRLNFTSAAQKSRLLGGASGRAARLRARMAKDPPITIENHVSGVLLDTFLSDSNLSIAWTIVSTSRDRKKLEYISTVEATDLRVPFSGTQWHPEKNAFEWKMAAIPHSVPAVMVTQLVANRFVESARRSFHRPPTELDARKLNIWNTPPVYMSDLIRELDLIFVYGPRNGSRITYG